MRYPRKHWIGSDVIKSSEIQAVEDTIAEAEQNWFPHRPDQETKFVPRRGFDIDFLNSPRSIGFGREQFSIWKGFRTDDRLIPEVELKVSYREKGIEDETLLLCQLIGKELKLGLLQYSDRFTVHSTQKIWHNCSFVVDEYIVAFDRTKVKIINLLHGGWEVIESVNLPEERMEMKGVRIGENIYLFGGMDPYFNHKDTVWRFSLKTKEFDDLDPIPMPTATYHCVTNIEDLVYLWVGTNIYIYDTQEDSWSTLTNSAPDRTSGGICHYNGGLFYLGGQIGNQITDSIIRLDLDTLVFDESWGTLNYPVELFGLCQIKDLVYLFGGWDGDVVNKIQILSLKNPACQASIDETISYRGDVNQWGSFIVSPGFCEGPHGFSFAPLHTAHSCINLGTGVYLPSSIGREYLKSCKVGKLTFLLGGNQGGETKTGSAVFFWKENRIEELDSYSELTKTPYQNDPIFYNDEIYCFSNTTGEAFIFDLIEESWRTETTQFAFPAYGCGILVNHYLYVFGTYAKRFDMRSLSTDTGTVLPSPPEAIFQGSVARYLNDLYFFNLNKILKFDLKNSSWSVEEIFSDSPPRFENSRARNCGEAIVILSKTKLWFYYPAQGALVKYYKIWDSDKSAMEILNGDIYIFDSEINTIQIPNSISYTVMGE